MEIIILFLFHTVTHYLFVMSKQQDFYAKRWVGPKFHKYKVKEKK